MKNKDILIIQKMIKYCNDVDILMTKFNADIEKYKQISHFNIRATCVLSRLEN